MLTGKSDKSQYYALSYSQLFTYFLPWIFTCLWITLTPPAAQGKFAKRRSFEKLRYINTVIKVFKKKYEVVPPSLTHLRAFTATFGRNLSTYDGYGQPIDYIWLSDKEYVLRSFGKDGAQNTILNASDISYAHVEKKRQKNVHYIPGASFSPYPFELLDGSISPDKKWTAKLYSNPRNQTKRLVVKSLERSNLLMIPRHEQIEQFFWLNDSFRILYTTINIFSGKTDIYLWNILTDRSNSLLGGKVNEITTTHDESKNPIEINDIDWKTSTLYFTRYQFNKSGLEKYYFKINLESKPYRQVRADQDELVVKTRSKKTNSLVSLYRDLHSDNISINKLQELESKITRYSESPIYHYLLSGLIHQYRRLQRESISAVTKRKLEKAIGQVSSLIISDPMSPPHISYLTHSTE